MISHLQFADEAIHTGSAKMENTWVIRRTLRNLELVSGLKVNFDK